MSPGRPMRQTVRWLPRLAYFLGDLIDQAQTGWSVARTYDCERNGGHRYGPEGLDEIVGWSVVCSRCGVTESRRHPNTRSPEGLGL